MQEELANEGHQVHFVAINGKDDIFPENLVNKAGFPIFQDTAEVDAWGQHGGGKDDMAIYQVGGVLSVFLGFGQGVETNLSTPDGYANVKQSILDAM